MFQAKGIDPRIREMIILRAAKVLNAPYELQANVVMAKNAGPFRDGDRCCRHRWSRIKLIRSTFLSAKRPMSCETAEHCAMRRYANFWTDTVRRSLAKSCL